MQAQNAPMLSRTGAVLSGSLSRCSPCNPASACRGNLTPFTPFFTPRVSCFFGNFSIGNEKTFAARQQEPFPKWLAVKLLLLRGVRSGSRFHLHTSQFSALSIDMSSKCWQKNMRKLVYSLCNKWLQKPLHCYCADFQTFGVPFEDDR